MSTAMIAMTTSNSTSVKPWRERGFGLASGFAAGISVWIWFTGSLRKNQSR